MTKLTAWLLPVAMVCSATIAKSQISLISGFETGSLNEGIANGGTVTNAFAHSGQYAYRANPQNSNQYIGFVSRASGGALRQIFKSARFYLYINALPLSSVSIVKIGGAATFNPEVDLNSDGTLTLADSWYPSLAKSQGHLTTGVWHLIEFSVGSGLAVRVDGLPFVSGGTTAYPGAYNMVFGAGPTPTAINTTADLIFDDILISSGSFAQNGWPGAGHVALMTPISDPLALNAWTNGAGTTSSLFMAVRNAPEWGKPAPSEGNMTQIKNASHGSNQDYMPSFPAYSSVLPAGAVITAVMPICNDGQEDAKGSSKSGALWIHQNPAQTVGGYSFDYGDNNGVIGAFPTGWATHFGPVSTGVNPATAPLVVIRKSSGANVDADLVGIYVAYQ
jgi:hypothetical protein